MHRPLRERHRADVHVGAFDGVCGANISFGMVGVLYLHLAGRSGTSETRRPLLDDPTQVQGWTTVG